MYAIERTRIIKGYLEEHGQAQVNSLSSLLNVSEVTVRRDLERLEAQGWLTRTHGGAIINRDKGPTVFEDLLPRPNDEVEVMAIARLALRIINDGDVVMLGNGVINAAIASLLEEKSGLTVLTNDVHIALHLTAHKSNRAVLLGGELDFQEKAVFGSMAMANLQKYYVGKFFFEADGINSQLQITVNSQEKADLTIAASKLAGETVALCLPENFEHSAFFRLGDVHLVQKIISSNKMDQDYKSSIFQAGIPLFTSAAAFEGSA